jgi:hypothetical protein
LQYLQLKKYKQRRERQRCIFLLKEKHLVSVAVPSFADKIMVRESMNNNNISSLEVIILVAVLVFVVAATAFAIIITEVQGVRGGSSAHITSESSASISTRSG